MARPRERGARPSVDESTSSPERSEMQSPEGVMVNNLGQTGAIWTCSVDTNANTRPAVLEEAMMNDRSQTGANRTRSVDVNTNTRPVGLEEVMMNDLGRARANWTRNVDTDDNTRPVNLEAIERSRAFHKPGTREYDNAHQNRNALNAWHNLAPNTSEDEEDETFASGQAHRSALRAALQGQNYQTSPSTRGGRTSRGGRGGGIAGTRGRGLDDARSPRGFSHRTQINVTGYNGEVSTINSTRGHKRQFGTRDVSPSPVRGQRRGPPAARGGRGNLSVVAESAEPKYSSSLATADEFLAAVEKSYAAAKPKAEATETAVEPAPAAAAVNDRAAVPVVSTASTEVALPGPSLAPESSFDSTEDKTQANSAQATSAHDDNTHSKSAHGDSAQRTGLQPVNERPETPPGLQQEPLSNHGHTRSHVMQKLKDARQAHAVASAHLTNDHMAKVAADMQTQVTQLEQELASLPDLSISPSRESQADQRRTSLVHQLGTELSSRQSDRQGSIRSSARPVSPASSFGSLRANDGSDTSIYGDGSARRRAESTFFSNDEVSIDDRSRNAAESRNQGRPPRVNIGNLVTGPPKPKVPEDEVKIPISESVVTPQGEIFSSSTTTVIRSSGSCQLQNPFTKPRIATVGSTVQASEARLEAPPDRQLGAGLAEELSAVLSALDHQGNPSAAHLRDALNLPINATTQQYTRRVLSPRLRTIRPAALTGAQLVSNDQPTDRPREPHTVEGQPHASQPQQEQNPSTKRTESIAEASESGTNVSETSTYQRVFVTGPSRWATPPPGTPQPRAAGNDPSEATRFADTTNLPRDRGRVQRPDHSPDDEDEKRRLAELSRPTSHLFTDYNARRGNLRDLPSAIDRRPVNLPIDHGAAVRRQYLLHVIRDTREQRALDTDDVKGKYGDSRDLKDENRRGRRL